MLQKLHKDNRQNNESEIGYQFKSEKNIKIEKFGMKRWFRTNMSVVDLKQRTIT